jgi:hypothetical protein
MTGADGRGKGAIVAKLRRSRVAWNRPTDFSAAFCSARSIADVFSCGKSASHSKIFALEYLQSANWLK